MSVRLAGNHLTLDQQSHDVLAGWSATSTAGVATATVARDTTVKAPGDTVASLKLTAAGTGFFGATTGWKKVTGLVPGSYVTVGYKSRAAATPRTSEARINWVTTAGALVQEAFSFSGADTVGSFADLSIPGILVPADVTTAEWVCNYDNGTAGEIHWRGAHYFGVPVATSPDPVVEAGATQTVNVGQVVTLTGAVVEGDGVTLAWSQVGGTTVTLGGSAATRTFTAGSAGTYTFRLTGTDSQSRVATDDTIVTVTSAGASGLHFYAANGTPVAMDVYLGSY